MPSVEDQSKTGYSWLFWIILIIFVFVVAFFLYLAIFYRSKVDVGTILNNPVAIAPQVAQINPGVKVISVPAIPQYSGQLKVLSNRRA